MKYVRWFVTIGYAGAIFYLSSRTWDGLPSFPLSDKFFHAVLYFGFGGLLIWALRTTKFKDTAHIEYIAFMCAVLYGLSDEIHQLFVPGREFSIFDLLADAVGAAVGIVIAAKIATSVRKQKVLI